MLLARESRGFTLIELVVAVGLFMVVMLLAAGGYLVMLTLDQRARSETAGIDNVSFAMDVMARTIKTATSFGCTNTGNGDGLCTTLYVVTPSANYAFSNTIDSGTGSIRGTPVGYITSDGSSGGKLTDETVAGISSLTFTVVGTNANDHRQPYVTITVQGLVLSGKTTTKTFFLQTGATIRGVDLN